MDAAVLSPPMMADVSGPGKLSSAELEVLKLQELVRKLEKQNEQLRSRANAAAHPLQPRGASPAPSDAFCGQGGLCGGRGLRAAPDEPFAYFQPSCASPGAAEGDGGTAEPSTLLDELELLDLDAALPATEGDSWLYVSPRARPGVERGLSPLQWCRQVLDRPGPEAELARLTLCHRIDQAKRWRGVSSARPFSCIEGLSALSYPVLPYSKAAAPTESSATPAVAAAPGSSFLSLRGGSGLSERTPTFLSNPLHNVGRRHAAISPQSSLDSEAGVPELENDTISMGYKLQDMTDVEVMARLQEESLRQDYASTSATAGRRSSSFSLHSLRRGDLDLEEEDDEEDEAYDQLPPPQPRLLRTGSLQQRGGALPHSHTFASIRDCRRSSSSAAAAAAAASPFSLSTLSHFSGNAGTSTESHMTFRSSTDKLRRSMPNLIRAPSMPSVPSVLQCLASPVAPPPLGPALGPSSLPTMPSLRSSQSFDSSNGLARLQSSIPPPGQLTQRVQSVGSFHSTARPPLKATAYVSPTVQQGPPPLPASASLHSLPGAGGLPQPLKPPPSSSSTGSLVPQPLKPGAAHSAIPRSSLPRPASFLGLSGAQRASKLTPPTRSLLTPPKSLASLSALRDGSWKDGCY